MINENKRGGELSVVRLVIISPALDGNKYTNNLFYVYNIITTDEREDGDLITVNTGSSDKCRSVCEKQKLFFSRENGKLERS